MIRILSIFIGIFLPIQTVLSSHRTPTNVNIHTAQPIAHTSSTSWACAGLDWWPESKCDYGTCAWGKSSLLNIDLTNTRLKSAVAALAPVFLRLGGSLCDSVHYDFPGTTCVPFSAPTNDTRLGYQIGSGCLSTHRWDTLNNFCTATGCSLLFGINALRGRTKQSCPPHTNCKTFPAGTTLPSCCTSWSGAWDSSNAKQLLEYTKASQHRVWGFEFGNELIGKHGIEAHLNATQYAQDFCVLSTLVHAIWKNSTHVPKMIAPDDAFDAEWYSDFLTATTNLGCTPDVLTWHQYILGAGVDPAAGERAMDPLWLDKQKQQGDIIQHTVAATSKALGIEAPEVWMGEAGGAYNSGRPGVTNAFHSSFWYLDGFGVLAQRGQKTFCRQTLVGGNYGLLNTTLLTPNPDFYALLLWRSLMGQKVLNVTDDGSNVNVRAYAHCSSSSSSSSGTSGDVVVLLINLANTSTAEVLLNVGDALTAREDYVMSSTALSSQRVMLNGKYLDTGLDGEVPEMVGQMNHGNMLRLAPLTYGFFVLKGVSAEGCM